MVKHTEQDPNNTSILKSNAFIIKLFCYIHLNAHLVTSNKSNMRSITYLCLPFWKKIQITHTYSSRLPSKFPMMKQIKSCLRGMLHMGGILLSMPPFINSEKSPGRFWHKIRDPSDEESAISNQNMYLRKPYKLLQNVQDSDEITPLTFRQEEVRALEEGILHG